MSLPFIPRNNITSPSYRNSSTCPLSSSPKMTSALHFLYHFLFLSFLFIAIVAGIKIYLSRFSDFSSLSGILSISTMVFSALMCSANKPFSSVSLIRIGKTANLCVHLLYKWIKVIILALSDPPFAFL